MLVKAAGELWKLRAETSLFALSGYIGGNFFWNGMKWGEVLWWSVSFSICSLCATWFLIIADVTLILDWNSNAKRRLCISLWHGEIDKKGLQSTAVLGFGLTCPTSQCGSQPTSAQMSCSCPIKQFCFLFLKKVIPVMDDDDAQSMSFLLV